MLPNNRTIQDALQELAMYCGSVALIVKDPSSNQYIQVFAGEIPTLIGIQEIMKDAMIKFWATNQPKVIRPC